MASFEGFHSLSSNYRAIGSDRDHKGSSITLFGDASRRSKQEALGYSRFHKQCSRLSKQRSGLSAHSFTAYGDFHFRLSSERLRRYKHKHLPKYHAASREQTTNEPDWRCTNESNNYCWTPCGTKVEGGTFASSLRFSTSFNYAERSNRLHSDSHGISVRSADSTN